MTARVFLPVTSLLVAAALASATFAEDQSQKPMLCNNANLTCGLTGISQTELLDSLYQGINNLPHGLKGATMGFPAEVLAAAYGIDARGNTFSLKGTFEALALFPVEGFTPHYYSYRTHRAMLSRLEIALSQAKMHMREPTDPPVILALNLPGIGPRVYDADQLRKLAATDLFPYPMHIEWVRSSGVLVPYVQLDLAEAGFVKNCLAHLGLRPGEPPKELITSTDCPADLSTRTNSGAVPGVPSAPTTFLAKNLLAASGTDGTPQKVKPYLDPTKQLLIAKILFLRATSTKPIRVETSAQCQLPQQLERDEPTLRASNLQEKCAFESNLIIPSDVGGQYKWIRVTVTPIRPRPYGLLCGPNEPLLHTDKNEKVEPECGGGDAMWTLSGDVLSSDKNPAQKLTTLIIHNLGKDETKYDETSLAQVEKIQELFAVRITLEGHYGSRVDDAIQWFIGRLAPALENQLRQQNSDLYQWCVPEDTCTK
jgi:hypothetical protein